MAKNAAPTAKENGGQGDQKGQEAAGSSSKPDLTSAAASIGNREDTSNLDGLPSIGLADSALPGALDDQEANAISGDNMATSYVDIGPFAHVRSQVKRIEVTAHKDGFRRAGLVWGRQPTAILLSELSDEQMLLLQEEKNLRIRPAQDQEGNQE